MNDKLMLIYNFKQRSIKRCDRNIRSRGGNSVDRGSSRVRRTALADPNVLAVFPRFYALAFLGITGLGEE